MAVGPGAAPGGRTGAADWSAAPGGRGVACPLMDAHAPDATRSADLVPALNEV